MERLGHDGSWPSRFRTAIRSSGSSNVWTPPPTGGSSWGARDHVGGLRGTRVGGPEESAQPRAGEGAGGPQVGRGSCGALAAAQQAHGDPQMGRSWVEDPSAAQVPPTAIDDRQLGQDALRAPRHGLGVQAVAHSDAGCGRREPVREQAQPHVPVREVAELRGIEAPQVEKGGL